MSNETDRELAERVHGYAKQWRGLFAEAAKELAARVLAHTTAQPSDATWTEDDLPKITGLGRPLRMYQSSIDLVVAQFLESGEYRSPTGGTLWAVLEYCHKAGISYRVTYNPGWGYCVERA